MECFIILVQYAWISQEMRRMSFLFIISAWL
jgi:hypothetical protein